MRALEMRRGGGRRRRASRRADYRAKHWTYLFETLRRTVDAIYETCRADRSPLECKEAIMILANAARDFENLIECINVEVAWESTQRPTAVAWEVRKTMGSPSKSFPSPENVTDGDPSVTIVVKSRPPHVDAAEKTSDSCSDATDSAGDQLLLLPAVGPDLAGAHGEADDGGGVWRVVRPRRRKSPTRRRVTAAGSVSQQAKAPPSVAVGRAKRVVMFPRSAMDIPQTKASMAKMAYSRRLIWEREQPELRERMQRREQQQARLAAPKTGSLPSLNRIGINFADPQAVRRSAQALRNSLQQRRAAVPTGGGVKAKAAHLVHRRSFQSTESPCSLESIREAAVEEEREPPDPQHRCADGTAQMAARLPAPPAIVLPNLEDDDAWQYLTEEEESLAQEEESLQKEIEEEERKSIDVELERQVASEAAQIELTVQVPSTQRTKPPDTPVDWKEIVAQWQVDASHYLQTVKWSELVELELASMEVRAPGEAVQMHEKLSSPSRKRNPEDVVRRHEQKLAKADELRQKLLDDKARRLRDLSKRVEEVRSKRQAVIERKKLLMDLRMAKARENREQQLQAVVRKAKDEDEKVHEIAFINTLEADNRRLDVLARHQDHEQRLQHLHNERVKRQEEKAAREAAVEERRRLGEEQRAQRRLLLADEKRRRQEEIETRKVEIERERQQQAKDRAKERGDRLTAHSVDVAAAPLQTERLSDGSTVDLAAPPSCAQFEQRRRCVPCDEIMSTELELVAHLMAPPHSFSEADRLATDLEGASKIELLDSRMDSRATVEGVSNSANSTKAIKKRRQKLRQKVSSTCDEWSKCAKESVAESGAVDNRRTSVGGCVERVGLAVVWLDSDVRALDRALGDLDRRLAATDTSKSDAVTESNYTALMQLVSLFALDTSPTIPVRCLLKAAASLERLLAQSADFCGKLLCSTAAVSLLDAFDRQLRLSETTEQRGADRFAAPTDAADALGRLLQIVLRAADDAVLSRRFSTDAADVRKWISLLCSLLVHNDTVDTVARLANAAPVDFVSCSLDLFACLLARIVFASDRHASAVLALGDARLCCRRADEALPTELGGYLTAALGRARLLGGVRVLYGELFGRADDGPPRDETWRLARSLLVALNTLAAADASAFHALMDGPTFVQLRHCLVNLWSHCGERDDAVDLQHELIVVFGHFGGASEWRQRFLLRSGHPALLLQLCTLPFAYFSDPKLKQILFPTLVALCNDSVPNREILEQEMSGTLLADFLEQCQGELVNDGPLPYQSPVVRFPRHLWPQFQQSFTPE